MFLIVPCSLTQLLFRIFLFLVFFVLASVLTCRLQKHGKHHLRKYVLKSEKTFSISNVCWTAALETMLGQIIKHNVFWQCLKSFFFFIYFLTETKQQYFSLWGIHTMFKQALKFKVQQRNFTYLHFGYKRRSIPMGSLNNLEWS